MGSEETAFIPIPMRHGACSPLSTHPPTNRSSTEELSATPVHVAVPKPNYPELSTEEIRVRILHLQ